MSRCRLRFNVDLSRRMSPEWRGAICSREISERSKGTFSQVSSVLVLVKVLHKYCISRYPVPVLPDSKEDLKIFLEKRWLEKEKAIEEFRKSGHFLHHGDVLSKNEYLTLPWAYFTHFVWIATTASLVFLLSASQVFYYMVIAHVVSLYVIPFFTNVSMFKIRKTLLRLITRRTPRRKYD